MGFWDAYYKKLPVWAQHSVVTAYGAYRYWLRFGPGFQQSLQDFRARDGLSEAEWQAWQQARLKSVLSAAVNFVPYYWQAWNLRDKEAALAGHLTELPILTKNDVRSSPEAFLRQDLRPIHRQLFHTSGSTGTPVASLWTVPEVRASLAVREARSVGWAGVSYKLPRATFSGRLVEPDPLSRGPFYRFNWIERQAYFSAFHLRPDTAHFYVEALRKHRIQWLTGYAVSYYLLAKFILDRNLTVPPLKAVITTSEKVTPEMRHIMESAYGCRVFEEYSTVENAIFASECERGRLHVSPDVALVEILSPDGSACESGEVGEVVTTSLMRRYQSFIRYRLGDLAMWDGEPCPCGRAMPVIKEVIGRLEDVVVGPDGRQMVRFHGIFIDQPHVREGQIIQETPYRIRVKVIPTDGFERADIDDIVTRVQQRLGPQVQVEVEPVTLIPRTTAGKFQAVISLLSKAPQR
ncbi:MAG: hypothetical protein M1609_12060 [Firmicutes bacterium]|nr:hypothetical protein [Bacillota bacterium]